MLGNMAVKPKACLLQNQATGFGSIPSLTVLFKIRELRVGSYEGAALLHASTTRIRPPHYYDETKPLDSTGMFSQNATGRLTAVKYPATKRPHVDEPFLGIFARLGGSQ
jgi:hypothetical protein